MIMDLADIAISETKRLEEENKKLREDFDRYGNHHGTCAVQHGSSHCDCGYNQLLKDKQ